LANNNKKWLIGSGSSVLSACSMAGAVAADVSPATGGVSLLAEESDDDFKYEEVEVLRCVGLAA
jgi:hypothetical protein